MAVYNSGPEGIAELRKLASRLPQILDEINTICNNVYGTYEGCANYLGEHTDQIESILTRMLELNKSTKDSLTGVAEDVSALASGYEELLVAQPYNTDL